MGRKKFIFVWTSARCGAEKKKEKRWFMARAQFSHVEPYLCLITGSSYSFTKYLWIFQVKHFCFYFNTGFRPLVHNSASVKLEIKECLQDVSGKRERDSMYVCACVSVCSRCGEKERQIGRGWRWVRKKRGMRTV